MESSFFSVIVPVYNTPKKYLDDCLASILAQTFPQFEILLVDDGSALECGQLCDYYAREDSRVRVIHQKNQGVSAARNRGIFEASAEWIMFVDADDWLELDACEKIKSALEQGDCDILMFNGVKEFANKTTVIHNDMVDGYTLDTSDVNAREWLYSKAMRPQKTNPIYFSWDKVYKRSFLLNNDLNYPVGISKSEDKVFILSCFEKVKTFRYVDNRLYHYRINMTSVCNRYSSTASQDRILLSGVLHDIAERMDTEIAELTENPNYKQITEDYYRFIFGIISDVLFLQYYHPDNPNAKGARRMAAKAFLREEPFCSAIKKCSYKELSVEAKLKKFLLSTGFVSAFCYILQVYRKITGKTASD